MRYNESMTPTETPAEIRPEARASIQGEIKMADHMTPTELAEILGTNPKMCRKFLRSIVPDRAGKGGRWALDRSQVDLFKVRFAAWQLGRTTVLVLDENED